MVESPASMLVSLGATLAQLGLGSLVVVFFLSGATKLASLKAFREGLLYIPYVRLASSHVLGYSLPFLEIIVACGLLFNRPWAKVAGAFLLLSFIAVTLLVLSRRLAVPCNCFGSMTEEVLSVRTIKRNVVLLGILAMTIPLQIPKLSFGPLAMAATVLAITLLYPLMWTNALRIRQST